MGKIKVIDNGERDRPILQFEDLKEGEFFKRIDHKNDDLYLVLKVNPCITESDGRAKSLNCQGHSYNNASGRCFPDGVYRVDVTITVDGPSKDQCDC